LIAGRLKNLRANRRKQFLVADECLDGGRYGPSWLLEPKIARHVADALVREHAAASFDAPIGRLAFPGAQRAELRPYDLLARVVMPNHVHVVLEPRVPLPIITRALKGVSARHANATLGRAGERFWQDESFDHWIRNGSELERVRSYVEQNPVKARLATRAEDWLWSSAWR
jgi:putative transposase